MAHFAELDANNVVVNVIKFDDNDMKDGKGKESEKVGIEYLTNCFGHSRWVQTSYNTREGQHIENGTPLRYRYAVIGGTYDKTHDVFLYPKQHETDVLNTETFMWEAAPAE